MKTNHLLPHNISQLKSSNLNHAPQSAHINGHHLISSVVSHDTTAPKENLSDEDEEVSCQEEEDEEDETEEAPRKWQGIEAIFEAYHEYVDGKSAMSLYACSSKLHLKVLKVFLESFITVTDHLLVMLQLW